MSLDYKYIELLKDELKEDIKDFKDDFKQFKSEVRGNFTRLNHELRDNTEATKKINGQVKDLQAWRQGLKKRRPLVINDTVLKIVAALVFIALMITAALTGSNLPGGFP